MNRKTDLALLTLLRGGAGPAIVAGLLEQSGGFSRAQLRYLRGPIILERPAMFSELPPWLRAAIYPARLEAILEEQQTGRESDRATLTEALAFMHPISLDRPLDRNWHDIYLWTASQVLPQHGLLGTAAAFWAAAQTDPIELNHFQQDHLLAGLARHIRRHAAQAAANGSRASPAEQKNYQPSPAVATIPPPAISFEQLFQREHR